MKPSLLPFLRLQSQHLTFPRLTSAKELVSHMGAIQAQDFAMAIWAIGSRLVGSTWQNVQAAIDTGAVLRTHIMRPTWHLVSSDHIHWMLELTSGQMAAATRSRQHFLGLTEKIISKSNRIIEKSLRDGNHLTREELMAILSKAKIPSSPEYAIHLMFRAELDQVACSGKLKNGRQTYALLAERAPRQKKYEREEALALLATKYFTSHGPATLKDFQWWSGLPAKDALHAVEMAAGNLMTEKFGDEIHWFTSEALALTPGPPAAFLLPAFDEFIIGYKDRSASVSEQHYKKTISVNGIFWPSLLINGQVKGCWKRKDLAKETFIEARFFGPVAQSAVRLTSKSARCYGRFLERPVRLIQGVLPQPSKKKVKKKFGNRKVTHMFVTE